MSRKELKALAATLNAIADGAEWECQWEVDGWGPPLGRDVEYCIANRILVRLKDGAPAVEPISDGGPAFPCHTNPRPGNLANAPQGMTLRDWFAGMALPACVSAPCPSAWTAGSAEHYEQSAAAAYIIADAMLAARKEGA